MPEETTTEKIISWIWERREEIQQKLSELYAWFRGPEPKAPGILILGPGGVGKTTLARLLAGQYDLLLNAPGRYDESIGVERYTLTDDAKVEIVVPPGQHRRREATWAEIHADIATGKYRGIILLSAFGYHTLGQISYKSHRLYQGNKEQFVQAFLHECRADEITVLRQLVPHVKVNRAKLWFLTLVAKQDLWWPKRAEAEKHYQQGEYGVEIQQLLHQQDASRFRHEAAFASLVISNFTSSMGERLAANAEGYDHPLQIESLRRLFETVDALKKWEAGK